MKNRDTNTIKLADGRELEFRQPVIMGVINRTPDSFYAGSRTSSLKSVVDQAGRMIKEGASLIDVGGYSSRPGAENISAEEEINRLIPSISAIKDRFPSAIISADTFRADVARQAIRAGASIINDISGGQLDEEMDDLIAEAGLPYIVMHMRGTPQTMKQLTSYEDLLEEVKQFLQHRRKKLQEKGVSQIIFDPGLGFAKTIDQNYALLRNLTYFQDNGTPLMVGLSRKSMIYKVLDKTAEEALNGTTALHALALHNGANIIRVHDVKEAKEVVTLFNRYQQS